MDFMASMRVLWERLRRALSSLSPQEALVIAGFVLCAAAVFVFMTIGGDNDPVQSEEMAEIRHRDYLLVGVRTDVPGFGMLTAGEHTGLETDIARALAKRVFGDEAKVEFVPVNYADRTSKLNTKKVDCVIALCEQGYTSTALFSQPYYTDAVGVVCNKYKVTSIEELKRKTIAALMRAGEPAKQGAYDVLTEFGQNGPMFLDIVTYSAGPDMAQAAKTGAIDGFAIESALIPLYYTDAFVTLPEAIGTEKYAVAVHKDNAALQTLCSEVINELMTSGQMGALYSKHNLTNYAA